MDLEAELDANTQVDALVSSLPPYLHLKSTHFLEAQMQVAFDSIKATNSRRDGMWLAFARMGRYSMAPPINSKNY